MVRTICNDCDERSQHPTQAEAFTHMDLHEHDHGTLAGCRVYVWQQFCNDKGWQNYRAPHWGLMVN